MTENIDRAEIQKFSDLAQGWWDPEGSLKTLHDLNPARMRYIGERCKLKNARVLDVGCGGGLLSESLALAGASVTGIDIAEKSLDVARLHLHESGLAVDYQHSTAEAMAEKNEGEFDAISCLEMLEHVPDPESVVRACVNLLKPGGQLFLSTVNRTPASFALAIVGAEYVLNLLPRGTHEYAKFIRPSELGTWLRGAGMQVRDICGVQYNPWTRVVRLGASVAVNYLVHASKPGPALDG